MKVKDVMTKNPKTVNASDTVLEAVKCMQQKNCGFVPVSDNDKLVGMITDRDVTIHLTADKKDPEKTRVEDVMTKKVLYCFEEDTLEDILHNFGEQQIHRLPVMNSSKRLVGVITLGDIARAAKNDAKLYELIGKAKEQICKAA
ncbi:MAG TPA: CBS domain-containing protein [Gammaproteobacteria bacterium]|nr:CBS domain-containing protein [Gammaproteobacteria bacterium]